MARKHPTSRKPAASHQNAEPPPYKIQRSHRHSLRPEKPSPPSRCCPPQALQPRMHFLQTPLRFTLEAGLFCVYAEKGLAIHSEYDKLCHIAEVPWCVVFWLYGKPLAISPKMRYNLISPKVRRHAACPLCIDARPAVGLCP